MKISKLTNGLLLSLLLSASVAEADSDYPATNFQPTVVYQDADYKHTGSLPSSKGSTSTSEVSVPDSDYPAANFQPEILFEDKSYKHVKGRMSNSAATESVQPSAEEQVVTEEAAVESTNSSMSLVMGLAVLAIAGFIFYSKNAIKMPAKESVKVKQSTKAPARKAAVRTAGDESASGVAKYLESKIGVEVSSVEKYLEERNSSSPVSSVTKYVAKKKISARLASVTGVEKYLKDRG